MTKEELEIKMQAYQSKLTVLYIMPRKTKNGYYWMTKCSCGNKRKVSQTHLVSGGVKSCGCLRNIIGKENPRYTGYEDVTGDYVCSLRGGAKRRNIPFNITAKDIWEQYISQNKKCKFTGLDLIFGALCQKDCKQREKQTASVDRKDSSKGYEKDNIQIIHSHVNIMKNFMADWYFIAMCKHVADFNKDLNKQ